MTLPETQSASGVSTMDDKPESRDETTGDVEAPRAEFEGGKPE